jgi:uncharacterized protein (DUF1778 family)
MINKILNMNIVELLIYPDERRILDAEALSEGISLSDYIVKAALQKARRGTEKSTQTITTEGAS